jgi:RHS repeat-associated protein
MDSNNYRHTVGAANERFFTGQIEDEDAGLYFFNARYLETGIARFISPDTIVPNPSDPRDHNRYSYVRNNPLKYTDPNGHYTCAYGEEGSHCDDWAPPELGDSQIHEERAQVILSGDVHEGGVRDPFFMIDTDYGAIEAAKYFRPRNGEKSVLLTDGAYLGAGALGGGGGNAVVVDASGNVTRGSHTLIDAGNLGVIPFEEERIIRRQALKIEKAVNVPPDIQRISIGNTPFGCLFCNSGAFDDSNNFAFSFSGGTSKSSGKGKFNSMALLAGYRAVVISSGTKTATE